MAGKTGRFKMAIGISKNMRSAVTYYEDYALQLSVKLTGATDISVPNATVVNSDADKLVTYITLRGKGVNIELSANVADFKADGISVNGILINLDIDLDNEKLMDKIFELNKPISKIDDGANDVAADTGKLYAGADGKLTDGISKLSDGAKELKNGTAEFKSEISGMEDDVRKEIDSILNDITGGDITPTSFVSSKNIDIQSVQFVFKTPPIRVLEADAQTPIEKYTEGFFEKFIALFAWNKS